MQARACTGWSERASLLAGAWPPCALLPAAGLPRAAQGTGHDERGAQPGPASRTGDVPRRELEAIRPLLELAQPARSVVGVASTRSIDRGAGKRHRHASGSERQRSGAIDAHLFIVADVWRAQATVRCTRRTRHGTPQASQKSLAHTHSNAEQDAAKMMCIEVGNTDNPCRCKVVGPTLGVIAGVLMAIVAWPAGLVGTVLGKRM